MAAPGHTFISAKLEAVIIDLEGVEFAKIVTIGFLSLTIYEYLITLDQEIEYFWAGAWTSSRVLFFLNRYLSPIVSIVTLMCAFLFRLSVSKNLENSLGSRLYSLEPLDAGEAQIFPPSAHQIGCLFVIPKHFWRNFLPSLAFHTFLYILTAYRALRNRRVFKYAPVMKRLVRDGGLFYVVILISVGFVSIGSFIRDPRIHIPATLSNFLLASTSIATSRLLFSIHSLATHIGSDSAWLLNNAELSRVGWKQGAHEGEIIVERRSAYDDDDKESARSVPFLKMSRVGVFEW
ncbi:hypothetical protein BD779DRAFT_1667050 [Infundibulicybe gibba]|nr:hypothetical protein BD779DRAFT_1667050 [Infundibulicybe gibba]